MTNLNQNSETNNTLTTEIFTRIKNDVNGNPRYVCHFLNLLGENGEKEAKRRAASYGLTNDYKNGSLVNFQYEVALKNAKKIGGRKYHNKQYGGGIVFQSYNIADTLKHIIEIINN